MQRAAFSAVYPFPFQQSEEAFTGHIVAAGQWSSPCLVRGTHQPTGYTIRLRSGSWLANNQKDTHLHPFRRQAVLHLAGGTAPSRIPANSFGRRPRWTSLTSTRNNWPPAGASARPPWRAGASEGLGPKFLKLCRPGALPAGRHRGLRGVVPADINQSVGRRS